MKIFHYTSRETALEHILPTGRLRFGTMPRTNDPREFAPVWFTIGGFVADGGVLTEQSPLALITEASRLLRESVRLMCFTLDQPSERTPTGRYGNGPKRARMWAQYAGNHSGACLVFDGDRLLRMAELQFGSNLMHQPVSYKGEGEYPRMPMLHQPQAEQNLAGFVDAMVRDNPEELFFSKDWDWASESEYRLLLRGSIRDEEFLDYGDALEAVIAGPRFHPSYKPGLWRICDELGIDPLEIQWQMGPPIVVRMIDPAQRSLTAAGLSRRLRGEASPEAAAHPPSEPE